MDNNIVGALELLGKLHGEVRDLDLAFDGSNAIDWLCNLISTDTLNNTYPAGGTMLEA